MTHRPPAAPGKKENKAVFLDRDGTIIVDAKYLSDPAGVILVPGAARALSLLREAGFLLFLHTNQSGIGRGLFTVDSVHRCNSRMLALLGLGDALFADICIAPEHPDHPSEYRKPSPRFVEDCVEKYGLVRRLTWMVGDKMSDVQTGLNAGINAALLGQREMGEPDARFEIYRSLSEFAQTVARPAG